MASKNAREPSQSWHLWYSRFLLWVNLSSSLPASAVFPMPAMPGTSIELE